MALKIRLRAQGSVNKTVYRIVVTDSRAPRDGKYLEAVGWFNPLAKEEGKKCEVKADRVQHWLSLGAELTEKVQFLVNKAAPGLIQGLKAKKKKKTKSEKKASAKPAAAKIEKKAAAPKKAKASKKE